MGDSLSVLAQRDVRLLPGGGDVVEEFGHGAVESLGLLMRTGSAAAATSVAGVDTSPAPGSRSSTPGELAAAFHRLAALPRPAG
ncbi:hypothetical protein A4E84_03875 [Streptomyces qaidamensis]|uniref:Uncharacterized protein n=1 Tax=Streptomyces qaidamensis TaxID=1783515 RepID=A0A143BUB6_9ACTN|nr:hypothetical protein A4E84_03875 [Streptomyces qaidamensis]